MTRVRTRAHVRLGPVLGVLFVCASAALACLWDTDTLRTEASGLPGVAEIIVGRFDRFPPGYYEARLARAEREVAERPDDLGLYDDAGVALDRLGRDTEAIAWMARKLGALGRLEASGADTGDHRYRYLANLGTFHAHRWIKNGADRSDTSDLERARELIARAIEVNPDAHFGRERYQLLAIEWLAGPPGDELLGRVSVLFDRDPTLTGAQYYAPRGKLADAGYGDAVTGLTGLVVLGGGWESVDAFHALTAALIDRGDASLALLAQLRREELIEGGRATLYPLAPDAEPEWTEVHTVYDNQVVAIGAYYAEARAEAEAWRAARNVYVAERLARGKHPDTDPGFWDEWVEPSRPPAMPAGTLVLGGAGIVAALIGFALIGFGVVVLTLVVVWRVTRRRATAVAG